MKDYANMDELFGAALEIEKALAKLGEIPFELLKDEHEGVATYDVVVEKQVNVLNESLINFFKQGITLGNGVGSFGASTTSICHICSLVDHVATICPRIGDLKPKCGKCGLPHRTKNCGSRSGYYTSLGHMEDLC
jgi:hypothetical protein